MLLEPSSLRIKRGEEMLYLYDPRTNFLAETSYDYLVKLTGMKRGSLISAKSRGKKLGSINCYLADFKTQQLLNVKPGTRKKNIIMKHGCRLRAQITNF